jgi:alpha-L-fucosidase
MERIRSMPIFTTSTRRNSCAAARPGPGTGQTPFPLSWRQTYFARLKDLIDKHQPDLLYNDGGMIYPEVSYKLVSHLYNVSAKVHGGKVEAVYTSKGRTDCDTGTCVLRH